MIPRNAQLVSVEEQGEQSEHNRWTNIWLDNVRYTLYWTIVTHTELAQVYEWRELDEDEDVSHTCSARVVSRPLGTQHHIVSATRKRDGTVSRITPGRLPWGRLIADPERGERALQIANAALAAGIITEAEFSGVSRRVYRPEIVKDSRK